MECLRGDRISCSAEICIVKLIVGVWGSGVTPPASPAPCTIEVIKELSTTCARAALI